MADSVLDSFLVKVIYDQDERSRKKFDAGLKSIQDNAQEFGKKIAALPEIVHEATKKISLSLTSLYYAAQQTRATEQQLHAFSRGIKDSGGDVDQANASYKSFVENINLYGSGLTKSIRDITGVVVDSEHPMEGYIAVWDKLHEMFMRGGEDRAKAGKYAEAFNIPVDQLALGRDKFHKSFSEDIARTGEAYGDAAKKASLLQIALNKLEAAFSNVVTKADVEIMSDYVDALDRISKWVDDNQDEVIDFIKDFVEQFRIAFHELKDTFGSTLEWLGGVIKDTFASLDRFLGNDDGGVKGLRIALEALFAMSLLAGLARLGTTLTLAMLPVTKFMLAAMALGLLGAGAYALYRSYVDQDALGGAGGGGMMPGGGRGYETSLAGRTGYHRSGGVGGERGGEGALPEGSLRERGLRLMDNLINKGWTPESAAMAAGNAQAESNINATGPAGDSGESVGMFQDRGPRRAALRAFQARHPEMTAEESNIAFYDQEAQQQPWKHERDMSRAGAFGHATEGYGSNTEAARTRMSNQWLKLYNERKLAPTVKSIEGKPLGSDQHSRNEVHDHRVVQSETNIHVAGGFPVEKTRHPLARPKMADVIRNTSSYVS